MTVTSLVSKSGSGVGSGSGPRAKLSGKKRLSFKAYNKHASVSFCANLLLKSLITFYNNRENIKMLTNVLAGKTISLSKLEWFITSYSARHNIIYRPSNFTQNGQASNPPNFANVKKSVGDEMPLFDVHNSYKRYVTSYGKLQFDMFCRGPRLNLDVGDGTYIETTVGQLNLFRWAITNQVIGYIQQHVDAIERDMADHACTKKNRQVAKRANALTRPSCDEKQNTKPVLDQTNCLHGAGNGVGNDNSAASLAVKPERKKDVVPQLEFSKTIVDDEVVIDIFV